MRSSTEDTVSAQASGGKAGAPMPPEIASLNTSLLFE
jgi:hypothetical protein